MSSISLSPAHAGSWVKCPAYTPSPYEQHNGNARYEGLALHDVGAQAAKDRSTRMEDFEGTVQIVKGEQVVITFEMLNRVKIYVDYVRSFINTHIESKIHCSTIHNKCKGIIDSWVYDPKTHHLYVIDYKDGRIEVAATECWQLICYVAGLINKHFQSRENNLKVSLVIVQPRSRENNKVKVWTIYAPYLRTYINILSSAAHDRMSNAPKSRAGLHCIYCGRKINCTSYNVTINNLIHACEYVDQLYDQGEKLSLLQYASKMINMSLNAEEAQALVDIKSGKSIKGFTVGKGRGSWKVVDRDGVTNIAQLLGVDPHKSKELLTPTQLMNAGIPEEYLDQYTERIPGKNKLVPINQNDVRKIFGE